MNCHEFRTRLSSAVESRDNDPDERSRLRQHVRLCPDAECRQLWADDRLLAGSIPGWRAAVPQASLSERVVAELRQNREIGHPARMAVESAPPRQQPIVLTSVARPKPTRSAGQWLACAVSAASLLLLISLLYTDADHSMDLAAPTGRSQATLVAQRDPQTAASDGPEAVFEVIRTYGTVPHSATEFVTATMVLFLPPDQPESMDSEPSRPAGWSGRLGEQLEPWGRDLGTVFEAFLDSVSDPPDSCWREIDAPSDCMLAV